MRPKWAFVVAIALGIGWGLTAYHLATSNQQWKEKARRAESDMRAAKRQAEIMVERRSVEDVSQDLDHRRF